MNKSLFVVPFLYLVLVLMGLFYILPIYVTLLTGLKDYSEISLSQMWDLPSLDNFQGFFSHLAKGHFALAFRGLFPSFYNAWVGESSQGIIGLKQGFWNSVKVSIPAALLSCILGSINGYILVKWKFRGANIVFLFLLFGMFIPYQIVVIPLVKTLQKIGLYGTLQGLILVHSIYGIPITTLIFRNYYK